MTIQMTVNDTLYDIGEQIKYAKYAGTVCSGVTLGFMGSSIFHLD